MSPLLPDAGQGPTDPPLLPFEEIWEQQVQGLTRNWGFMLLFLPRLLCMDHFWSG